MDHGETNNNVPKYCGNCGRKLVEGEAFCGQCGTPVSSTNQRRHSEVSSEKPVSKTEEMIANMSPLERKDYVKGVKRLLPASIVTTVLGLFCVMYAVITYTDNKNRYWHYTLSDASPFIVIVGGIGGLMILCGIAEYMFYQYMKDKL